MLSSVRFTILSLAALCALPIVSMANVKALAQAEPGKPPATAQAIANGSLSGRVTSSDNKQSVRLADVFLIPKAAPGSKPQDSDSSTLSMIQARTQSDGSFTVRDLPAGDYFVVAHMAGYILPVTFDESAQASATGSGHADLGKFLASFPVAHVTPGNNVSVDISLTPGTAISGHIEFEDGTPVVGQWIEIQSAEEHDPWRQVPGALSDLSLWAHQAVTDDEGRYRFSGLPPGKYWLFTIIQPEMDQRRTGTTPFSGLIRQSFTVYSPGVFRKSLAKTIEVKGSEQQIDSNIIVSINKVHAVRGKVVALGDQHPLNFGFVSLKDPKDEKDFSRSTPLDSDGTFHFDDVPDGAYNLTVSRAADVKPGGNPYAPTILHSYEDGKMPVTLSSQDAVINNLVLEESKKTAAVK